MKIGGIDPKTVLNEVFLVLPRGETQLVFRAIGLKDMEGFDAQCPMPKAPGKRTPDGIIPQENDPTYLQQLDKWGKQRLGYMAYHSLNPSEIEWDIVKENDPRTWGDWEKDLRDGGLSEVEFNRVLALVMEANALDEAKLKKARDFFLRGQVPPLTSNGSLIEPLAAPSGEPVQD